MSTQLKKQFFQAFFGTLLWITGLLTLFLGIDQLNGFILWSVIGLSFLIALVFGVFYLWLWQYSVMKSSVKILLASVVNLSTGLLAVYVLFLPMFYFILPWIGAMFLLEVVLHTIIFHFYTNYENKKYIENINQEI